MPDKVNADQAEHTVFTFGDFSLDTSRGVLSRGEEVVSLRPKTWSVLLHFLQHRGELVSRTDLIHAVWNDASVTDDSVTQCIVEIRRALGDSDFTLIRTVPRRGFVFEMHVEERRVEAAQRGSPIVAKRSASQWSVALIITVLVTAAVGLWSMSPVDDASLQASATDTVSIAVLAFTDMTAAKDRQYFGDGVAEEILNHLARIPNLRVISRSSSFMFGDTPNISQIAERLGVDFVLEGSVRGAGDDLRITVQLINANANSNVWVESYDREISLDNLVAVQTDIGARVAAAISVETGLSFSLPPERAATVDAAAMDNYLQGLFYIRRIQLGGASRETFDAAIEHMSAAIEIDPDWAPPHAAIGLAMHFLATSSHLEPDRVGETFEEARLHLLQALRLDPGYGPAYGSLAFIAHAWDLDFERAEALYEQAKANGHERPWGEAIMLRAQGRLDDAIIQYRQAALNDPLSRSISLQLADTLRCAGRYDEAARHIDVVSQNHPDLSDFLWEFRAELSLKQGDLARARQIMDEHRINDDPVLFARVMAVLGMREEAEAALAVIESGPTWSPRNHMKIAVALGQEDRALDYLQQVAERYPRYLTLIQCPDEIGPLADDPRFRRLLVDSGIPVNIVRDTR